MSLLARAILLVAAFAAASARSAVIDTFETPGAAAGPLVGGLPGSETAENVPGALGETRIITAGGIAPDGGVTVEIGGGSLRYTQTGGLQGFGAVDWEFFTGTVIDFTHPFDLTEGGTIEAFEIDVLEQSIEGSAYLGVQSACDGCLGLSRWQVELHGPGVYRVPFASALPSVSPEVPADLSRAVTLALSFQSLSGAEPGAVRFGPLSTVPEAGTAGLLLALLGAVATRKRRSLPE